jgi:N utilization substance protein B
MCSHLRIPLRVLIDRTRPSGYFLHDKRNAAVPAGPEFFDQVEPLLSKRRRAREMAIQMLYQSDLGRMSLQSVFDSFRPNEYSQERASRKKVRQNPNLERMELEQAFAYAQTLVRGTQEHLEEIDDIIRRQAEHWRLERMPAVDRNILRLAVFEFLYETDVPQLVVLDEAIELAKEFGTEQSGRFVNGVLDGILKTQSLPGTLT